mgnify:CR=1 FL=1
MFCFFYLEVKMDRKQQIELTNMCLVYDENRILVEEKRNKACRWFSVSGRTC